MLPFNYQWMLDSWTWSKLKPVIRCAAVAWLSLLLMLITSTEKILGQASFLILIAAFLDPPSNPFISCFEREFLLLFFATVGWAWGTLGIFVANQARTHFVRDATLAQVLTGQYVEAGPTVIMAVFLFLGTAAFLYIKARQGPGPFLVATVFGCICLDLNLTSAVLYPYPQYQSGRGVVLPLAFHSAFCLVLSAILFPSTITAQYTGSLVRVLDPLHTALLEHRRILQISPCSTGFPAAVAKINGQVNKSEGALTPSAAALHLLKHDIVWGRFAPADIGGFQWWVRRLVMRANGMNIFFTLVEPTRERFPITPVPSRLSTPGHSRPGTPAPSRPTTPGPYRQEESYGTPRRRKQPRSASRISLRQSLSRHLHLPLAHQSDAAHDHHLHFSLLHLAHSLALTRVNTATSLETAVGVFESQRYLAMEASRTSRLDSAETTERFMQLLSESCDELLGGCADAITGVKTWLAGVRRGSFCSRTKIEQERARRLQDLIALREKTHDILERFRKEKRHRVLDPYRSAFDPNHVGSQGDNSEPPPHRYLFHCFVYQYHAMEFGILLVGVLDEIIRLENACPRARLWTTRFAIRKIFAGSRWDPAEEIERGDDEDPDVIQGMEPEWSQDLGFTSRRDPDALPPTNLFQKAMYWLHKGITALSHGNAVFALKGGLLTVLLCIPNFLKSTAEFAYGQRFFWGIFMGQLTLARFRGDTTFGLVARIMSTFLGGVVGMVMWYISAGSGLGSPYGLAAVCAVCFPVFFYGRLYWPGPPMTNAIFFVTTALVVGYSWQDTHFPFTFHYWGFDLAWRRFVLVTAGVTAAFIFSFLPPSTTLRQYQRKTLATTAAELGTLYCSIVSFANTRGYHEVDKGEIIQSLVAIRMKLKRSLVLKTNVIYEFSLRGKWPADRYHKILEIQLQLAYLLSHLMSVVEHLEPAWSRAFLRRTRFIDSDFQGDVLAVISMISTSLRTGTPLPQITPCPLLDRFMTYTHGLNVIRQEADDDYGLPRTMTIDTLENEQYLCFSVGVTTAFGIIMRLDKLMVATKELVGEQYHIHGIGLPELKTDADEKTPFIRPHKEA
ncbi:hypothetical protein OBBRIDRAFT_814199 [Obba rivulosa]|uniref:DUF2421 domain-containing protein n=1 Tax=Obba rivulosa TaxID=1052685 RepID=A0A8E2AXJ9_9APHY|nr:hypothetical protein OBBRIDRAFT_814199 [Obba rivulosa]